jgi:Tfp pilus assembly protein PilF
MQPSMLTRSVFVLTLALSLTAGIAGNQAKGGAASTDAWDAAKIPIITASDEARKEFLQGRDLSDRLLGQESLEHFDRAIALDPDFASAELARANSSATAKDFFDHLKKAVSLADKASDGEKLLILANEAGANGDSEKQKNYLEKLVANYPHDERAQYNLGTYYLKIQKSDRNRSQLFPHLQYPRLRLPAAGQLCQRRTGIQEVRRADAQRSESLRFLRGVAAEDGAV